ncbi:MAG: metal ABC transporter substrate-binding protein [Oscillospiraceae bacterium]|nr:metal ABC transporter substrate-binding protein [Oscillospiraceae bacterium]
MKRYAAILLALALCAAALAGCGQVKQPAGEKKRSVICTIFPQYDWARQILGERLGDVDLTLLLGSKTDLHNYQPTVDDIVKISNCDLFIYVGGESDGWVDDALAQAVNKGMITINLLEALGDAAKEEELLPGMEPEEEEEGEEEEGPEYDEHVWLSLKCAQVFCPVIADALATLDPDNAAEYRANAQAYDAQLAALDAQYRAAVDAAPVKTLLFGDRFPFRYLKDDYGLECFAAFPGCSAETEASFETIARLAETVDERGLKHVMVIESGDQSVAKTIVNTTAGKDQRILVLDSMQSVTFDEAKTETYLGIMEGNLKVLREALG